MSSASSSRPWLQDSGPVLPPFEVGVSKGANRASHRNSTYPPLPSSHLPLSSSTQPSLSFDTHKLAVPATARKPLRSSPLAGPAISRERPHDACHVRPINTLSTPDLASLYPQNVAYPPRPKSSQASLGYSQSPASLPYPANDFNASLSTPNGKKGRRKLTKRPKDADSGDNLDDIPPLSFRRQKTFPEKPSGSPLRPDSLPLSPPPSAPAMAPRSHSMYDALNANSTSPNLVAQPRVIVQSRVNSSWYTFSPWAEIPRFTRLGLKSPNVVLPLSRKEYHSKQQDSKPLYNASRTPSRVPSLTRSSSGESAGESVQHHSPINPSIASSADIPTIVEDDETPLPEHDQLQFTVSPIPRRTHSFVDDYPRLNYPPSSYIVYRPYVERRDDERNFWSEDEEQDLSVDVRSPSQWAEWHKSMDVAAISNSPGGERERKRGGSIKRLLRSLSGKRAQS